MNIAWFQYNIEWLNPKANFNKIKHALDQQDTSIDILVLPEMFDTGFVINPNEIQNRNQEKVLENLKTIANTYDVEIMCSTLWEEGGKFTNRAFFISTEAVEVYDKVHLFLPGGEGKYIQAGKERNIIQSKNKIKVLPLICYDLRFPEISRNHGDIDLLVYSASWPKARIAHWDTLLRARAIENQCFVLGVNRLGTDGNGWQFTGHSQLFDFTGKQIDAFKGKKDFTMEGLRIASIDFSEMHMYRSKLPFLKDIKYKLMEP